MKRCPYCGSKFVSISDLELHKEHEHPMRVKEQGAYGYFEALQARYSSKKRVFNR